MFSKPNKPTITASTRADPMESQRKAIACSLIAENVSLEGDLISDGDVQLDGSVRGDLKLNHLTIGETGQVDGLITAETVEVRGRVSGAITAKTVRLYTTAQVDGDITHVQIAIDSGAHFAGRSVKLVSAVPEQLSLVVEAAE
jgi:cytoskeletal protein CcmA (bactofilin family)